MKKKMIQLIVIALCGSMLLSACGSEKESTTQQTTTQQNTTEQTTTEQTTDAKTSATTTK